MVAKVVKVNESGKGEKARSFRLEDRLTQRMDERNPERYSGGAKGPGEDSTDVGTSRPAEAPGLASAVGSSFAGVGKVGARQPGRGRHTRSLSSSTAQWARPSGRPETPPPRPPCPSCRRSGFRLPSVSRQALASAGLGLASLPPLPRGGPSPAPLPPRPAAPAAGSATLPASQKALAIRLPESPGQGWRLARTRPWRHFAGASHLRWRPSPSASVPTALPPSRARPSKVGGQAGEPRPEEARQNRTEKPAPWHLCGIRAARGGRAEGKKESSVSLYFCPLPATSPTTHTLG